VARNRGRAREFECSPGPHTNRGRSMTVSIPLF
jgi:hypothetical protein